MFSTHFHLQWTATNLLLHFSFLSTILLLLYLLLPLLILSSFFRYSFLLSPDFTTFSSASSCIYSPLSTSNSPSLLPSLLVSPTSFLLPVYVVLFFHLILLSSFFLPLFLQHTHTHTAYSIQHTAYYQPQHLLSYSAG